MTTSGKSADTLRPLEIICGVGSREVRIHHAAELMVSKMAVLMLLSISLALVRCSIYQSCTDRSSSMELGGCGASEIAATTANEIASERERAIKEEVTISDRRATKTKQTVVSTWRQHTLTSEQASEQARRLWRTNTYSDQALHALELGGLGAAREQLLDLIELGIGHILKVVGISQAQCRRHDRSSVRTTSPRSYTSSNEREKEEATTTAADEAEASTSRDVIQYEPRWCLNSTLPPFRCSLPPAIERSRSRKLLTHSLCSLAHPNHGGESLHQADAS